MRKEMEIFSERHVVVMGKTRKYQCNHGRRPGNLPKGSWKSGRQTRFVESLAGREMRIVRDGVLQAGETLNSPQT